MFVVPKKELVYFLKWNQRKGRTTNVNMRIQSNVG